MNLIPKLARPLNWLPPARWRTRFEAIEHELTEGGPLAEEFEAVAAVAMERGDLAAQDAIEGLVNRHRDLFPGEAGSELAWSILCGSRPRLHRYKDAAWTNPFDEPVEPYRTNFSTGGKNRFSARERDAEPARKVLDLLRGDEGRAPMNHRQVAAHLGLKSGELHSHLWRIKQRMNVPLRDQRLYIGISEQRYVAEIRAEAASLGRREREPVKDLRPINGEPIVLLSSEEASQATGIASDELIARGVESYSSMRVGVASKSVQMLKVPQRLCVSEH